jgi:hypothetical protein
MMRSGEDFEAFIGKSDVLRFARHGYFCGE